MRVRFTAEAGDQLLAILLWLRQRSPRAADTVARRVEALVANLEEFPHLGQRHHALDIRVIPLGHHPYLVSYIVEEDEVRILSIRHTSRRPPQDQDLS